MLNEIDAHTRKNLKLYEREDFHCCDDITFCRPKFLDMPECAIQGYKSKSVLRDDGEDSCVSDQGVDIDKVKQEKLNIPINKSAVCQWSTESSVVWSKVA